MEIRSDGEHSGRSARFLTFSGWQVSSNAADQVGSSTEKILVIVAAPVPTVVNVREVVPRELTLERRHATRSEVSARWFVLP